MLILLHSCQWAFESNSLYDGNVFRCNFELHIRIRIKPYYAATIQSPNQPHLMLPCLQHSP